jgi:hypothetical protein
MHPFTIRLSAFRAQLGAMVGETPKPGSGVLQPAAPEADAGMTYETFLAERNAKLATSDRQDELLDNSLITLSGGALGLALAFLHDHGSTTAALPYAIVGMAFFALCLTMRLGSIIASQKSISAHIDALDAWCRAAFKIGHPSEQILKMSRWASVTQWFNGASVAAFMVGAILTAAFVVENLASPPSATKRVQGESN